MAEDGEASIGPGSIGTASDPRDEFALVSANLQGTDDLDR